MYSSGIHKGGLNSAEYTDPTMSFAAKEEALHRASLAKIDAMIARAELKPGEHAVAVMGSGEYSFKGSGYVRGRWSADSDGWRRGR